MNHTKGPWKARQSLNKINFWFIDFKVGKESCTLTRLDCNKADAILIAAAPKMLKVLKFARMLLYDTYTEKLVLKKQIAKCLRAINKTINKATKA